MVGREGLFAIGLVGRALVRPGRALRAVEERARGGTRAAAFLVLVAIPLSRASNLLPQAWDVDRGSAAAKRTFLTMLAESTVTAALVIGVLLLLRWRVDHERRRPGRDVELAATCCLPALVVRLVAGLVPSPRPMAGADRLAGGRDRLDAGARGAVRAAGARARRQPPVHLG